MREHGIAEIGYGNERKDKRDVHIKMLVPDRQIYERQ